MWHVELLKAYSGRVLKKFSMNSFLHRDASFVQADKFSKPLCSKVELEKVTIKQISYASASEACSMLKSVVGLIYLSLVFLGYFNQILG